MIIFLYGPDTFRSLEKLKELKEQFKKAVPGGALNLADIDGEKLAFADFKKELSTVSFLAKRRMVIFRNIIKKGSKELQKEIIALLKKRKDDEDDNILIFWEEDVEKQPLYDFLIKEKNIKQEFKMLKDNELRNWIISAVRAKGGNIEPQAVIGLLERIGNNLWQLNNELDKLISFDKNISVENIVQMVKTKDDENIFNLTDAIGNKNKKLALKLLQEQLRAGLNVNYILTMLAREYRLLMELKDYLEKEGKNASPQIISRNLKLHPFAAKKLLSQEKLYRMEELAKLYSQILKVDLRTKTSNIDPEAMLDLLIVG